MGKGRWRRGTYGRGLEDREREGGSFEVGLFQCLPVSRKEMKRVDREIAVSVACFACTIRNPSFLRVKWRARERERMREVRQWSVRGRERECSD